MVVSYKTIAAVLTSAMFGLLTSGCAWLEGSRQTWPSSSRWAAVTALGRGDRPDVAATQAAAAARQRMGSVPARAVVFFECFGQADIAGQISAAVQAAFPQAEVIGCSASAVATADGSASDHALALLAIGGEGFTFSSAYAPATFPSSQAAGKWLSRQLGFATGGSAMIVLADPTTLEQPAWDANDLLARLVQGRGPSSLACGGLASPRGGFPADYADYADFLIKDKSVESAESVGNPKSVGRPSAGTARVHHAGRSFAGGVAVLQIAGPLAWQTAAGHEQLRVEPIWQPRQIAGRLVGQLASNRETLPAATAIARRLIAQDRPDAHIGRFVGELPVPLNFEAAGNLADGGAIRLPVQVTEADRLVLLRPAPPPARVDQLEKVLARVQMSAGFIDGPPFTLLTLPAGPNDAYVKAAPNAVPAWQAKLSLRASHPTPIAFLGPGQFVPVFEGSSDGDPLRAAWTCQFSNHLFGVVQIGRQRGGPASVPTTAPAGLSE